MSEHADEKQNSTINEKTAVSISLFVLIGGAIWWASALQTKVDSLLTLTATNQIQQTEIRKELDALRERVLKIESHKP